MVEPIQYYSQPEYNRILNAYSAMARGLGHGECERILMQHGASQGQAKNGAFIYLHHAGNQGSTHRGTREEYTQLLDKFDARHKTPKESVCHLKHLGFSYGQAHTAVYNYRKDRDLIGKK